MNKTIGLLLLLATACSQPVTRSDSTENTATKAAKEKSSADSVAQEGAIQAKGAGDAAASEQITVPGNISGALLHCTFANDPADKNPEIAVGCRFEDQAGARVAVKDIATLSIFSFSPPAGSKAEISVQPLVDTSTYDVAYFFKAEDQEASKVVAENTEVQVAFKGLKSGEKDRGLAVKLGSILEKALAYIREAKVLGKAAYAVVASSAGELKDAAKEKAKEIGTEAVDAATQAKDVFKSIFGL